MLINKEERNCYVMVFLCWIACFVPDSHLAPQSILVICGKNDRLAFDGSTKLEWDSVLPVNCMTNAANEPDLIFQICWNRRLICIHNLRISYPKKEIELLMMTLLAHFNTPSITQKQHLPYPLSSANIFLSQRGKHLEVIQVLQIGNPQHELVQYQREVSKIRATPVKKCKNTK